MGIVGARAGVGQLTEGKSRLIARGTNLGKPNSLSLVPPPRRARRPSARLLPRPSHTALAATFSYAVLFPRYWKTVT